MSEPESAHPPFTVVRMFTDDAGHTRFEDLPIPGPVVSLPGDPASHVLGDVPATTVNVIELLARRKPLSLHAPPRRQWVIILQGALEISTELGERRRFTAGHCLLAEDMVGTGHTTDDVGAERLVTFNIGVPDDWSWPDS